MSIPLILLPHPQQMTLTGGTFSPAAEGVIALDVADPGSFLFMARQVQDALAAVGLNWRLVSGTAVPSSQIRLHLSIDPAINRPQAYHLDITPDGIHLRGSDAAGAFYGIQTLIQLVNQTGGELPLLKIEDWPDLRDRGVMVDISRDKVPTMDTLYRLIDMLAGWKINQFQLYTEHTFAYQNHPDVWAKASPITAEEVLLLDAYCRERFIDFVPNQNCFGHMNRWFEHEQYMPLAEAPEGFMMPWGGIRSSTPFSLNPSHPDSLKLVDSLFAELLPNFSSGMVNVNCDETWDLGQGGSKAMCEAKGRGRVYLEFLQEIQKRVAAYGRTMQYWGDIVGHYPELVPELPPNAIALEWGYEAAHPFDEKGKMFADAGVPFYVCPGTSSWNTIAGRTDNAIGNIRNAVNSGFKHGALGMLNTDWGDGGHWQTFPVSFVGFAYGAGVSWAYDQNAEMDSAAVLNTHAFADKAGVMGKIAYELGNMYQRPGLPIPNANILSWAYLMPLDLFSRPAADNSLKTVFTEKIPNFAANLRATIQAIDEVIAPLHTAQMQRTDAVLVQNEWQLAADMLKHGAFRLLAIMGEMDRQTVAVEQEALIETYRTVWLARNRPGGLDDSVARLTRQQYYYPGIQWDALFNVFTQFM